MAEEDSAPHFRLVCIHQYLHYDKTKKRVYKEAVTMQGILYCNAPYQVHTDIVLQ